MSQDQMPKIQLVPFRPALWAQDRHSQTILADALPSLSMALPGEDFFVDCGDGDRLLCHFHPGTSPYILIVGHGLTGSADAGYTHRVGRIFHKQGHGVLRMNHRNCGKSFGLSKFPYHAGRSEDMARIVYDLRERFPNKKIVLLGFSMSGNCSLLLASGTVPAQKIFSHEDFETQTRIQKWSQPDFVIAVNPPVELSKTTDRFLDGIPNRFYQWNFVRYFHSLMIEMKKKNLIDPKYKTRPWMSIREFDDHYTSERAGFTNAESYYQVCSAKPVLSRINLPTVILTSKDDPLISFSDFQNSAMSKYVHLHVEDFGGHMGFLSRDKTPLGDFRWLDYAILEIFKTLTQEK